MKTLYIALVSLIIYLLTAGNVLASNLYLLPENTNITTGTTTSVDVTIDTKGESVNGVSAFLTYPKDMLEVAWISYGSAFPVQAEEVYGDGIIKISRGSFTGETGNVTVATIGFKGKASGEAFVSFIDGSFAPRTSDSSDSLNLSESTGIEFTVTQPQVKPSWFSFFSRMFSLSF